MIVYDKYLGRHSLESVIGMSSLVTMVLCIAHFFIDILLLTSYHHSQGDFQRFYLCLHFGFLILTMIVLVYGFSALSKATYHSISNLRSWTLFCGLFLFSAGFFSTVGFSLDWVRFREECITNFHKSHNEEAHDVEMNNDVSGCRSTWTALLVTHALLWSVMMTALGIMFFSVNSYKSTHFADEVKQRALRHREELRRRNRRLRRDRRERKLHRARHDDDDEDNDVEVQEEERDYVEELDRLDEKTMHVLAERLAVAALAATKPISDSAETLTVTLPCKRAVDADHIEPSPTACTQQPRIPDESRRIYALNRDMPHAKQDSVSLLAVPKIVVDNASQHCESESETSSPPTSGHGFLAPRHVAPHQHQHQHQHQHRHRAPSNSHSPAMIRTFTHR